VRTPTGLRSEREELLALLLARGILRRTEHQPVLSPDGTPARWMLDSLAVTLTPSGAEMAGRLILERLGGFDGRQLATYGLTAVPILQSVILQSAGRYHGLLVRKERKAHGSQKLIEGPIDPDEPTILIEDSIASGRSVGEGIATLEAAGLRVEGCVSLVRFGWEGGCSTLSERGYHVEGVYDIFEDFMARMEGEEGPDRNPTRWFPELRWSARRAPDGLHPASLARAVVMDYLRRGEVLRPPARLDRDDYDSSGGAWVSLRARDDIHERHARDGFWHFPGERSWGVAEDIVRAAVRTAHLLAGRDAAAALVDASHIGVTLFAALEPTTVGGLDNDRYGIVVVSAERPDTMGGALPRMPGIRDAWQQFRHARYANAGLDPHEPYHLYRHDVRKLVEPGTSWPLDGVPRAGDDFDGRPLAGYAREIALGHEPTVRLDDVRLPADTSMLFVTVYIDGQVRGCMGSDVEDLAKDLAELTHGALADERFADVPVEPDPPLAVSVSVLGNELEMGDWSPVEVRIRYRHGEQALMVDQNGREGLLLPCVATWLSLDAEGFVDEVIDKAGVTRAPYNWRRFDCDTWLADESGVSRLDGAFKPSAGPPPPLTLVARLHADYLLRNQRPDGSLYFSYYPFQNTLYQGIDMARLAHAAWTLARAGLREAAVAALEHVLRKPVDAPLALSRDAFVLLTLCEPGIAETVDGSALAAKLWASIDRHGRVTTWSPPPPAQDDDEEDSEQTPATFDAEELQHYVPGQVLLALAAARRQCPADGEKLHRAFSYYRHRFRHRRDFGQVAWMALAWAAWWRLRREPAMADLVFEIADWILEFQAECTGAFLTDHQPDTPGYTSAVYLEAVAAAARTAADTGDGARHRRYADAFQRGFGFLDRLVIQDRDASVLPNPEYAVGGLRENLHSSHVRVDFVQHALAAILTLQPDVFVTPPKGGPAWPRKNDRGLSSKSRPRPSEATE
jgi:orotate phosphoribosyltransferase/AMMECR1 domain-containing protein